MIRYFGDRFCGVGAAGDRRREQREVGSAARGDSPSGPGDRRLP
jgi:hypothetical protein